MRIGSKHSAADERMREIQSEGMLKSRLYDQVHSDRLPEFPTYEKYFGFTASPFPNAPDPNVFYFNPVYQSALGTLRHGLATRNGLVVLSGPVGTGKTALLTKLFHDLGSMFQPIWLGGRISFPGILRTLLTELGAPSETNEVWAMIDKLRVVLYQSAEAATAICLIIEEAQNLDGETLEGIRQLSNFEGQSQKLLQLVLVGEPQLVNRLEEPENYRLKQRVALHCRLFALSRGEVGRYIAFHLQAAGYLGTHLFDDEAIDSIARHSGGVPRLVNFLCETALLAAYRSSKTTISRSLIDEVAGKLGLVTHERAAARLRIDKPQQPKTLDNESEADVLPTQEIPEKGVLTAPAPRGAARTSTAVLLALIALGGTAWALYSVASVSFPLLFNFRPKVNNDAHSPPPAELKDTKSVSRPQELPIPGPTAETQNAPAVEPPPPVPQTAQSEDVEVPSRPAPNIRQRPVTDPAVARQMVRAQVQKAIQNRAITGVSVRLVDRTIYLEGLVASERQKAIAETAALGARDGLRVENQIKVQNSN